MDCGVADEEESENTVLVWRIDTEMEARGVVELPARSVFFFLETRSC